MRRIRWTKWAFLVWLCLLGLGGCGDESADDDSGAEGGDDDALPADDDAGADDDTSDGDDDTPGNPLLNPEEPGPYLVGNRSYFFTDATRELSCGDGKRVLLTEVWYPAADNAMDYPENYLEDFFLGRIDEVREALGEQAGDMNNLPTGSYRGAPLHPDAGKLPVLFFSHGFMSNRFQNFTMADYLASHGYIVVAPDHICNSVVTLTPTAVVLGTPLSMITTLPERIADMSFLMDVFEQQPPELFAGHIDTARFAIWGHSFGGLTATEVAKREPRVKALLQLASFGFPFVPDTVTAPSMYFWGKQDKVMRMFKAFHYQLIAKMPPPKMELEFFNTGHFAFSDLCDFVGTLGAHGNGCGTETRIGGDGTVTNPDHDKLHGVLDPYATAFFGAALYGLAPLEEYLAENHFPGMMEYQVTTH